MLSSTKVPSLNFYRKLDLERAKEVIDLYPFKQKIDKLFDFQIFKKKFEHFYFLDVWQMQRLEQKEQFIIKIFLFFI